MLYKQVQQWRLSDVVMYYNQNVMNGQDIENFTHDYLQQYILQHNNNRDNNVILYSLLVSHDMSVACQYVQGFVQEGGGVLNVSAQIRA